MTDIYLTILALLQPICTAKRCFMCVSCIYSCSSFFCSIPISTAASIDGCNLDLWADSQLSLNQIHWLILATLLAAPNSFSMDPFTQTSFSYPSFATLISHSGLKSVQPIQSAPDLKPWADSQLYQKECVG